MNVEIFNKIKSKQFVSLLIENAERISCHVFALDFGKTVNSLIDESQEWRVKIGADFGRIWERALIKTLNQHNIPTQNKNDSRCDIIIDGIKYEVKSSRHNPNNTSWTLQGSTHGNNKCPNLIAIRYELNQKKKISTINNHGWIVKIYISIHENIVRRDHWKGKATDNNSRTTFRLPIEDYDIFIPGIIFGDIQKSKKLCKLVPLCCDIVRIKRNALQDILEEDENYDE